jgi:hypothetical protein
MDRDQLLKLIDENNAEISKLQRRLAECNAQDRWLHSQLPVETPKAYVKFYNTEDAIPQWEDQWETEGGQ